MVGKEPNAPRKRPPFTPKHIHPGENGSVSRLKGEKSESNPKKHQRRLGGRKQVAGSATNYGSNELNPSVNIFSQTATDVGELLQKSRADLAFRIRLQLKDTFVAANLDDGRDRRRCADTERFVELASFVGFGDLLDGNTSLLDLDIHVLQERDRAVARDAAKNRSPTKRALPRRRQ